MNTYFNRFTEEELEREQWRDVYGYDGAYQVSDLGRVRSRKKSGEWRKIRQYKQYNGYLFVMLYKDGKAKKHLSHRLVAQYFVPNDNLFNTVVHHIDECKQNNSAKNLQWVDYSYNNTYNDINLRRKNSKLPKIKDLYDPNLSIDDNLEVFRANGVECCDGTVRRLRKDLGLTKSYNKNVRSKIEELYNQNLTIDENIKLFKEQGIEVSKDTVINLRRDLGLTGSRNVRNKVKDLYDQNLNYEDNLKVFKENGVECSRNVIFNIRKQLGLVKSTKKK